MDRQIIQLFERLYFKAATLKTKQRDSYKLEKICSDSFDKGEPIYFNLWNRDTDRMFFTKSPLEVIENKKHFIRVNKKPDTNESMNFTQLSITRVISATGMQYELKTYYFI